MRPQITPILIETVYDLRVCQGTDTNVGNSITSDKARSFDRVIGGFRDAGPGAAEGFILFLADRDNAFGTRSEII